MARTMWALPLFLLCAALPALADIELHGRVLDDTGAPIAGARVLLYLTHEPRGQERLAEGLSAADGSWVLVDAQHDSRPAGAWWTVVALAPNRAVAGSECFTLDPVDIVMHAPAELTGRVTGPRGALLAGARVSPYFASAPVRDHPPTALRGLPLDLRAELSTTADAEGRYRLAFAPSGWLFGLTCEAEGYGTLDRHSADPTVDFVFPAAGRLSGRVTGVPDPERFAGFQLHLGSGESLGNDLRASASAEVGTDGSFRIPALPAATYHVTIGPQVSATHHIRGRLGVIVKPGEETVLELPAEPIVRLRGRIVDARSGDPIVGAHVTAAIEEGVTLYKSGADAAEDGAFDIPCVKGDVTLSYIAFATDAATRYEYGYKRLSVAQDPCDAGDLELWRTAILSVRVVDEAGKPVEGATVHLETEDPGGRYSTSARETTDANGDVTMWPDPGAITLTAEKGLARTSLATRLDGGAATAEPVVLILQAGALCGARARVVDGAGLPVEGVHVRVERVQDRAIGSPREAISDAEGAVSAEGLDPDCPLRMVVTPTGAEGTVTPWRRADAGTVVDLGDLAIRPFAGVVTGVVADPEGAPIAGAEVRAYSIERVGTAGLTDAAGRFRLEALPSCGVVLVARAPGFGLGGTSAHAGEETKIVLRPEASDPPADPALPLETATKAGRAARALRLVEAAVAASGPIAAEGAAAWQLGRLLSEVAPLAPKRALTLAERGGEVPTNLAAGAAARRELADSPETALERLDGIAADWSVPALLERTQQMAYDEPDSALLRARTALKLLDRIEEDWLRVSLRAHIGRVLHVAGDPEGAKLVLEAADEVLALCGDPAEPYARLFVAAPLAVLDPDVALELMGEPEDPRDRATVLTNIARELADDDPDRALALLGTITERSERETGTAIVLPFLPPGRQAQAVLLARGLERPSARTNALARLANATPREQARELLGEAAALVDASLRDGHEYPVLWELALLACLARRLGTGQAYDFAWRCVEGIEARLQARPDERPSISGAARAARALAFVDRELACSVLESAIRLNGGWEAALSDTSGGEPVSRSLLAAAAEIDPAWAIELWRALPQTPGFDMTTERLAGACAIVHRLLTPSEVREAEMLLSPRGGDSGPDAYGWVVEHIDW